MKAILFTGSHRLLLANEIFPDYDSTELSYYFYLYDKCSYSSFSFWTLPIETVIARSHKEISDIKEINEKEYLKIISLLSIGLSICDAFELTFNIGEYLWL